MRPNDANLSDWNKVSDISLLDNCWRTKQPGRGPWLCMCACLTRRPLTLPSSTDSLVDLEKPVEISTHSAKQAHRLEKKKICAGVSLRRRNASFVAEPLV